MPQIAIALLLFAGWIYHSDAASVARQDGNQEPIRLYLQWRTAFAPTVPVLHVCDSVAQAAVTPSFQRKLVENKLVASVVLSGRLCSDDQFNLLPIPRIQIVTFQIQADTVVMSVQVRGDTERAWMEHVTLVRRTGDWMLEEIRMRDWGHYVIPLK